MPHKSTPYPLSDHYDGRVFFNPGQAEKQGFKEFLTWVRNRERGSWPEWIDIPIGPAPPASVDGDDLRVTLVNHATFLIQFEGLNILTDPIWSKRCSPVSFAGPKRVHAPGIRFEELPEIHIVLISHNHYDHMDIPTLKRLHKKFGPRIYVPLGNLRTLARHGIQGVQEMDWWQEAPLNGAVTLGCVPARHFSSRGRRDQNKCLWAGFVLNSSKGAIYFAGDTGFGPHFEQIALRYPDMRLTLLPIGAFLPEWFMAPHHINPQDAVRIHLQLRARTSIAMHHGTFPLGDDGYLEPKTVLLDAVRSTDMGKTQFVIAKPGEPLTIAPLLQRSDSSVPTLIK